MRLAFLTLGFLLASPLAATAAEVRIQTDAEGRHTLLRDGQPYLVKGANWPTATTIEALVAADGNSVRTYGDEVE